jgi:hypothetical protein
LLPFGTILDETSFQNLFKIRALLDKWKIVLVSGYPLRRGIQNSGFHFRGPRQTHAVKRCSNTGIAVCSLLLSGCGLFGGKQDKPKDESPTAHAPRLVGRIASIPPDKRFVLIQSYGTWKIGQGELLTTRGPEERSANLLVTGESLGQFAAADLQSGTVEIGDAVYSRHVPKPPEPAPSTPQEPELPENQMSKQSENVQKNN